MALRFHDSVSPPTPASCAFLSRDTEVIDADADVDDGTGGGGARLARLIGTIAEAEGGAGGGSRLVVGMNDTESVEDVWDALRWRWWWDKLELEEVDVEDEVEEAEVV